MVIWERGCDWCHLAVLQGRLPEVGRSYTGQAFVVDRCPVCSTYWIATDRSEYPVSDQDASRLAPDVVLHG